MHNMKAPNILPMLYCIEILGVLLCGIQSQTVASSEIDEISNSTQIPSDATLNISMSTDVYQGASPASPTSTASSENDSNSVASSESSGPTYTSPPPAPNPTTTDNTFLSLFFNKECLNVVMMAGGLIIACFILLLSTLLLTCKVCQMSRRIKMLSSQADLISTSEYWVGTAKKNKNKSETEAKETTILMADISQTQEEVSTTKEEEEKVMEDGEKGEEDKEKSGDTANSEEVSADEKKKETLVIGDENPSSPKLQEEAADSQSTKAVAVSSSEGTEEPKDVM